jgi:SNF2 family DNA or RNA helicase
MEIDGKWVLIYDKFIGDHTLTNKHSMNYSLKEILEGDFVELTGETAIKEVNSYGTSYEIPQNLDSTLYSISVFIGTAKKELNIKDQIKFTLVHIDHNKLKDLLLNNKTVPNLEFLEKVIRIHYMYHKSWMTKGSIQFPKEEIVIASNTEEIVKEVTNKTGDIIDAMIEKPNFISLELYPYQKRTIKWLVNCEKKQNTVVFNLNEEVSIGNDIYYDVIRHGFNFADNRKKLVFKGGALIDEVGLGKTIQITTMSLLNPAKKITYIQKDCNRLNSKATLVLCPSQLCGQWKRELETKINKEHGINIVSMLTKSHYDKYTYKDLLDADFVLVSYSFLDNQAFLTQWVSKISQSKSYHKSRDFNLEVAKKTLDTIGNELVKEKSVLTKTQTILPLIKWHRVVVDEFHEVFTVDKYNYIRNMLPLFDGTYKWCVTGTPFNKSSACLYNMIDYVTGYTNTYGQKILTNYTIKEFMKTNFFRRNTKKSVIDEYKLPPVKESVIWLKFSQTERMMYNAYLANPQNDKYSIFLRQLCCHPKLADEIKDILSNCKTLADIEKTMIGHYKKNMETAMKKMNYVQHRYNLTEKKLKRYEKKRQRRMLKKLGYKAYIQKKEDDDEIDKLIENPVNNSMNSMDIDLGLPENILDKAQEEDSDSDDDEIPEQSKRDKKTIIISDDNQKEIIGIIGKEWNQNRLTYDNMITALQNIKNKLVEMTKDYEGKKTTFDFYNNVLDKLRKNSVLKAEKKKKKEEKTKKTKDSDDSDSDSSSDEEDEDENCGICLSEIPEDDVGVTKCGHIFCYQCIKTVIAAKHECPYCRKSVKDGELYMISYEKPKDKSTQTKEIKDKLALINAIGTKLANLIYYLKKIDDHVIIFSQWDDLLRKVGTVLDEYGIRNVFCRGNIYQRDKAIRTFNNDDKIKVIMLSSESAASGTNLTKASKVILLDPVYGSYEFRRNTEWQAVGRAHRMGQTKEVETVRFVIKNTIEEEIYNLNIVEDKKHVTNMKIFESNDDTLTLSDDKIDEIAKSAIDSKKKKEIKPKKTTKKKEINVEEEVVEEDEF